MLQRREECGQDIRNFNYVAGYTPARPLTSVSPYLGASICEGDGLKVRFQYILYHERVV